MKKRISFLFALQCSTAVVILGLISGCAAFEGLVSKPTARLASVEIDRIDFDGLTVRMNVEVDNPNPIGLNLSAYDYDVDAWNTGVVEGRIDKSVSLRAKGKSILPVPVTLDFSELVNLGGAAMGADTIPLDIALGLEIAIPYMGGVRLDLSGSIEVPIPKMPEIPPAKMRVESIDFTGALIALEIEVANPNAFAMDIRSLSGHMSVGGNRWGEVSLDNRITLAAKKRESISVALRVSFAEVGRTAWNLLSGSGNTEVQMDGTADIHLDVPGFDGSGADWDADARVSIIR